MADEFKKVYVMKQDGHMRCAYNTLEAAKEDTEKFIAFGCFSKVIWGEWEYGRVIGTFDGDRKVEITVLNILR